MLGAILSAALLLCGFIQPQHAVADAHPIPMGDAGYRRTVSHPEMRAFWKMVGRHSHELPLRDMHVIGIQHLLGSTGGLLRAFAASGAKPEHMLFMGKTYSQHESVMADLRLDGFGIHAAQYESGLDNQLAMRWKGTGDNPRRDEIRGQLNSFVARIRSLPRDGKPHPRILVVDDGGELIELIHNEYKELHDHIVAVEQTTHGLDRIKHLPLAFPVVKVADAFAKTQYESPMIGHSIARSTLTKIDHLRDQELEIGKETLVLGFGNIGRATAASMDAAKHPVAVFDTKLTRRLEARDAGYKVYDTLEDALPHGRVVISTTGSSPFQKHHFALFPHNALLVNAASSSTEFRPDQNWSNQAFTYHQLPIHHSRQFRMVRGRQINIDPMAFSEQAHLRARRDWSFNFGPRNTILVANQGTVINFDGSVDPIPPRYIQLTRGLLYLAAVQASRIPSGTWGVRPPIDLDHDLQNDWVKMVEEDLAMTGESLLAPRF